MKRNRRFSMILAASLIMSTFPQIQGGGIALAATPVSNIDTWDGTSDTGWYDAGKDEFEITTAEQLAGMVMLSTTEELGNVSFKGKTIKLMNNLDLGGYEWGSVGAGGSNSDKTSFNGTFDGQGHVIYNLTSSERGVGHGLFGTLNKGTIKNLGLENADVYIPEDDTTSQAGILADWANESTFLNCYTTGSILSERLLANDENNPQGSVGLGGLIGQCTGKTEIIGCYSSAEVRCEIPVWNSDVVGGLVGQWETSGNAGTRKSRIQDCWFDGTIVCTSDSSGVGGILGANFTFQTYGVWIENCFVKPSAVSCDVAPGNFCYIAAIDNNGTIKGCFYSEPETESGKEEEYCTGVQLIPDWDTGTAEADPDYVADVALVEDPSSPDFLAELNENASKNPKITWIRGKNHPTFSWDSRNRVPDLTMTATASDAQEAKLTAKADMDGTLWYSIYERDSRTPVTGEDLEKMVNGQEGDAYGKFETLADQNTPFSAQGLKPDTEYTVCMGIKSGYDVWSDLVTADIKTMKEILKGTVTLSGFPVVGEELTAVVSGSQADAELIYTWYRGKEKIEGEEMDTYLLTAEDSGRKVSVVVSADNYRGTLTSGQNPEIAREYTVTRIEITKAPRQTVYGIGDKFDRTGMEVKAYLKASSSDAVPGTAVKILEENEYDVAPETFTESGTVKVTVSYMGAGASFDVTVVLDDLTGSVTLSGDPVAGEKLLADAEGMQADAKTVYKWYRDDSVIPGENGRSYLLQKADAGHEIHVEITALNYAGKLVSEPTQKIQGGYTVSEIKVTRTPDKTSYKVKESFDGTGMEVTAYLKINPADETPAKENVLAEGQYMVSCNLNVPGTAVVTVSYRQDGRLYQDTFEVEVQADPVVDDGDDGEDNGDSSGGNSRSSAGKQKQTAPETISGSWHQTEAGKWTYVRDDGMSVADTWVYIAGGTGADWYRFDGQGLMKYGWYLDQNGRWYYLSEVHDGTFGAMVTGWLFAPDGHWYYLKPEDGVMATGWMLLDNRWYYFNPVGVAVTWVQDSAGIWQWTGSDILPYGAMYANRVTPDGWIVGTDGARLGKAE